MVKSVFRYLKLCQKSLIIPVFYYRNHRISIVKLARSRPGAVPNGSITPQSTTRGDLFIGIIRFFISYIFCLKTPENQRFYVLIPIEEVF